MTENPLERARKVLDEHEAFAPEGDGYVVLSTAFKGIVTPSKKTDGYEYTVTVTVPAIEATTVDDVGPAVATDWLLTFKRRLEDAPKATRSDVELSEFDVTEEQGTVEVTYGFEWDGPHRAATIAKTLVEYVEGTYVEGIIPGYEYESPVSDLLAKASQQGESGTPL